MFGSCSEPIKLTRLFHTELEILNIQSQETTTYDWLISTCVRRSCKLLANWKFSLRGSDHLGLQNQKRRMQAINDPSTNFRLALLTAVDTGTLGFLLLKMLTTQGRINNIQISCNTERFASGIFLQQASRQHSTEGVLPGKPCASLEAVELNMKLKRNSQICFSVASLEIKRKKFKIPSVLHLC